MDAAIFLLGDAMKIRSRGIINCPVAMTNSHTKEYTYVLLMYRYSKKVLVLFRYSEGLVEG